MVGPDAALRRLTRDAGKLLRPYGFQGDDAKWVYIGPGGIATVSRARVVRSWTDGQQTLRFGLALSATPLAWWHYRVWLDRASARPDTPLAQASGPGLLDERGLPPDLTTPWTLRTDPADLAATRATDIAAIRADLPRRVHAYARRALRLLDPDAHRTELSALPDPDPATREATIVLLSTHGPSPELDSALAEYRTLLADRGESPAAEALTEYLRDTATADRPALLAPP